MTLCLTIVKQCYASRVLYTLQDLKPWERCQDFGKCGEEIYLKYARGERFQLNESPQTKGLTVKFKLILTKKQLCPTAEGLVMKEQRVKLIGKKNQAVCENKCCEWHPESTA